MYKTSAYLFGIPATMNRYFLLCFILPAIFTACTDEKKESKPPHYNVLFITIDDLRPQLGCYGDTVVKSPNIDRLANNGALFRNAYCQQALCGPSRTSFLTGIRPESSGIYDLETHFRTVVPDVVTLPQLFKKNGYQTASLYKVFHAAGFDTKHFPYINDTASWTTPAWFPDRSSWGPEGDSIYQQSLQACLRKGPIGYDNVPRSLAFEAPDIPDSMMSDGETALKAISMLRKYKENEEPFFLAVGFYKPHLPFVAPKKYWDVYDSSSLELPTNQYMPENAPPYAALSSAELRSYVNIPNEGEFSITLKKLLLHGYLASVSYIDAQVGMLLEELERLGLRENTIVVLMGDHGYQIGEHNIWAKKHTNYEMATRAPLIISVLGHSPVRVENSLVELVDVYPTLAELCGLPVPDQVEGFSLASFVKDPSFSWQRAAYSTYPRGVPGYGRSKGKSIRTERYRLIDWSIPEKDFYAYELYDHTLDPMENKNIANDPSQKQVVEELVAQLNKGWKDPIAKPN